MGVCQICFDLKEPALLQLRMLASKLLTKADVKGNGDVLPRLVHPSSCVDTQVFNVVHIGFTTSSGKHEAFAAILKKYSR